MAGSFQFSVAVTGCCIYEQQHKLFKGVGNDEFNENKSAFQYNMCNTHFTENILLLFHSPARCISTQN